jgi:hypothetical protein
VPWLDLTWTASKAYYTNDTPTTKTLLLINLTNFNTQNGFRISQQQNLWGGAAWSQPWASPAYGEQGKFHQLCSQNSKSGLDRSTNIDLSSNVPTRTQANSLPPPQSLRLLPQPRHPALGSSPHHNPPTSTFTPTVEGTRASSYLVAHPWQTSLEPCWARINFHANISIMSMNDKQSL